MRTSSAAVSMNVTRFLTKPCRRISFVLLPWLLGALQQTCRAADFAVLTNAAQVRQLTAVEARAGLPVRLQGTVIYWDPGLEVLVVQDDTAGVFVRVPASELPLARGLLVSVEGVSAPGDYAPAVEEAAVRVLGKGRLPEARTVDVGELVSGRFDGQRVTVHGVVAEVEEENGRARLHVHVGSDSLAVVLRDLAPGAPEVVRLVDAEVNFRGVCRIISRPDGRPPRLRLLVPGLDEVDVVQSGSSSSASLAVTPIAKVPASNPAHRVKVLGRVVSLETNGSVMVKDGTGEIRVNTRRPVAAQPGDMLEVLGFPIVARRATLLDHGVARVVAPPLTLRPNRAPVRTNDQRSPLPLLQTIADIRRLSPEEAALGHPVRLRGLVTFIDQSREKLFVRDATNGILVEPNRGNPTVQPGQIVEVTGFSDPGDYVTMVRNADMVVQAQGELPPPRYATYESLRAGREDSQWVAIDGIVRSAQLRESDLELDIAAAGGRFSAVANGYGNAALRGQATNLIDAEVRIVGVCRVLPNNRRQAIGFKVYVPGPAGVVLIQPAPPDPYALPMSTAESLFSFGAGGKPGHRVRIDGTVSQVRGGNSLFLHDGTGGLKVEGIATGGIRPGDRLDVVGFPVIVERAPRLQNAIYREIESGAAPEPRPASLPEALAGQFDGELIVMQARLVDVTEMTDQAVLILQTGDAIFEATLPDAGNMPELKRLPIGGFLRLTGIGSTQPDDQGRSRSFRLLLDFPAAIEVLARPPWWDLRHALRLAAVLGVITLGSFAWVWLLRKRVREQTAIIRQRLETEARLESRYRELFDNATDIVYTTDLEGRITSFNKAAELLTGYSRVEAIGRNLADLVGPNQAHLLRPFTPVAGPASSKCVHELEFVTKDGTHLPVEVDTQPLVENGRPVGAQGIARDITERKRAERTVHELNASLEKRVTDRTAELQAANKELEAFSYSVSHDLRAPLRAINGFSELLLKNHGAQLEGKAQRYLQNVALGGRKMGQLVDDLLAFSRLNRHAVARAPLDLAKLAREVVADLRRQEPAREVAVTVQPLPPARGDAALMQQVLYNLLGNAWKFTAKKPDAAIELGVRQNGQGPVYFVRDNGAGFDMKYADKLFGVFQRLHRDDEFPGTGVGLAIVHRIITRHGGRVWAEAGVNEGSTFFFTLPAEPPQNEPASPMETSGPGHE